MTTILVPASLPTRSITLDLPSLDLTDVQEALSSVPAQWVIRNDTSSWSLTFRNVGAALDVSGLTIQVVASNEDTTLFSLTATVTDGPNGLASFDLTTSQTSTAGSYLCEITLSNNSQVYSFTPFPLFVVKDVS